MALFKPWALAVSKSGSLGLLDVSSRSLSTSGKDLKLEKVVLFTDMPTDRDFLSNFFLFHLYQFLELSLKDMRLKTTCTLPGFPKFFCFT